MTDNQKLKKWLEGLPPETYQKVINDIFAEMPDMAAVTLIHWLSDGRKIPLFAMCTIEKVSENHDVPFTFGDMEVTLFRKHLDDIWLFVNMSMKDATEEAKMCFAHPIVMYEAFVYHRIFDSVRKEAVHHQKSKP